jgi:Raf kinase inhibitor-like YbhB/YbcL family protein
MQTPLTMRAPGFTAGLRPAVLLASLLVTGGLAGLPHLASAHDLTGAADHTHYDWSITPPVGLAPFWLQAQIPASKSPANPAASVPVAVPPGGPEQARPFLAFAPTVQVHWDDRLLYVESNGLPSHGMMVGITAWQQQVPMPQNYTGVNAWHFPLHPVPAAHPQTIRGHFLRGAIAIAADGVPIFNPQNNRGEISLEIGELDQWGGHAGRADDYHYHVTPLHLQAQVGPGQPVAYALDGYPIFGLTEPDGSPAHDLDDSHGHTTAALGYHYHASDKYPYVFASFHGEVEERDGQVDPQPNARPVRPSTTPLPGARIVGFSAAPDQRSFTLRYTVSNRPASVSYSTTGDGRWHFHFVSASGATQDETYQAGGRGGGGQAPRGQQGQPPQGRGGRGPAAPASPAPAQSGTFQLRSPVVGPTGELPREFTGDGDSISPPLEWSGPPEGTKSFAIIMHHVDPEGVIKWYWTLYNLPAATRSLPKNTSGLGTLGSNSINRQIAYAPPHSQGPGLKTYVLTIYALSAPLSLSLSPAAVTREVLLTAMKEVTLGTAELRVNYTRPEGATSRGGNGPARGNPPKPRKP